MCPLTGRDQWRGGWVGQMPYLVAKRPRRVDHHPGRCPELPPALFVADESTVHLAQVVHGQETGVLSAARERLEGAIVGVESRAPRIAGLGRRLLETLANLGI